MNWVQCFWFVRKNFWIIWILLNSIPNQTSIVQFHRNKKQTPHKPQNREQKIACDHYSIDKNWDKGKLVWWKQADGLRVDILWF